MNKKIIKSLGIIFLLFVVFNTVNAQKANEQKKDTIPFDLRVYENAMLIGDYDVARTALLYLVTAQPNQISYLDSLARIYYATGMYAQALISSEIYLKKDEKNVGMMEISTACYNILGDSKKALSGYEALYTINKRMEYLYQIAVIQYQMKRLGECEVSVNTILNESKSSEEKISINMAGQYQEVPVAAAAYNLSGVMNKELGKTDKAKSDFENAIKLFPEYVLAQNNLSDLLNPSQDEEEIIEQSPSKKRK
ncbi:MAG TPA: tetratricopeptide repeat protein [Bacteroidia bacterium]|nr:tetratricopeptide repeat protein [Bacteroidia bacterium]HNT80223.1 tetratricopeptide repeat protein [Bacteroidia bacterium]